jgi:DNA polymerase-3 subunit delta'
MSEEIDDPRHPRVTQNLFGHVEAEQTLLAAYKSGRIAHAWLIGGIRGVGKATLAYRMARFVLAHPDPASDAVQSAASLAVDPENSAARKMAAQAHPNLLLLERTLNDKGKMRTVIAVDDTRRSVSFFGSTAGEAGWRVAIIDTVDDLNKESANSLLKVLEEPPERSLFLLLSEAGGRVLPTIRSRCRLLSLRPLETPDVERALAAIPGIDADATTIREAAVASEGSIGQALELLDEDTLELRRQVLAALAQLPNPDPRALHALSDAIGGTDPETLALFAETVNGWLAERLSQISTETAKAAHTAQAYESINQAVRDADAYNLDRKPLVFSVFGLLADAARG